MADGNEALSVDQLRDALLPASATQYGLVKVMTDDELDEYMSGVSGADNEDILTDGIYVVTVQQAIKYLDKIYSGGGSGSDDGTEDSNTLILWTGRFVTGHNNDGANLRVEMTTQQYDTYRYIDVAHANGLTETFDLTNNDYSYIPSEPNGWYEMLYFGDYFMIYCFETGNTITQIVAHN